jgi:polyhydroxybutyrate depolymerase
MSRSVDILQQGSTGGIASLTLLALACAGSGTEGGAFAASGRPSAGGAAGGDGSGTSVRAGTSGTAPSAASGAAGGGKGGASGGGDASAISGASVALPSSGCGLENPPASSRYGIDVSGSAREYVIKIPDGYEPNHPYRLVFGWHGAKYDANWVANGEAPLTGPYFGLESEALGSAIFVAPQALSGGWSTNDLAFADAMVSRFETELCIDKSRIFSVGFSMGAIMTITLGCSRSEVFRGIAPMSGSLPSNCSNGSHVAYWASHGSSDTTIPIANGEAARDEFLKRNHCTAQTLATDRSECVTYLGCDQGYPVAWCTFTGVHEPAPFAGSAIWQFLSSL